MKDHSILLLVVHFVCILLKISIFGGFANNYSFSTKKWHDLGSLKSIYFKKKIENIFQNLAERRQIDVRRGMPSFASIPVTPRTLFTKNRGGFGSDPPRRSRVNSSCVSLTFSGLLVKAEQYSTINSEPIRHYSSSPCISKHHFDAAA